MIALGLIANDLVPTGVGSRRDANTNKPLTNSQIQSQYQRSNVPGIISEVIQEHFKSTGHKLVPVYVRAERFSEENPVYQLRLSENGVSILSMEVVINGDRMINITSENTEDGSKVIQRILRSQINKEFREAVARTAQMQLARVSWEDLSVQIKRVDELEGIEYKEDLDWDEYINSVYMYGIKR